MQKFRRCGNGPDLGGSKGLGKPRETDAELPHVGPVQSETGRFQDPTMSMQNLQIRFHVSEWRN